VFSIPVTFNVVPESIIGAVGVVGGSFTAVVYRMRKERSRDRIG
jgi:hypothetical protein